MCIEASTETMVTSVEKVTEEEHWLSMGQIVYLKKDSLAWRMVGVVDDDPETTLLKKKTRPYVVVSKTLANRIFNTVWLMPIKSATAEDSENPNKVVYQDQRGNWSEIETKIFLTAQVRDLDNKGAFVPKKVMEKVVDTIVWNLPFQWHKE